MKLFRALSVSALCFLTRHTCAAVPVFEDTIPSMRENNRANGKKEPYSFTSSQYNTKQWKENQERKMANYILQEIKNCRSLLPSENGFLVHIDYSTSSYMLSPVQETSSNSNSLMQKRVLRKLVKTWKSMPTDQRLQAVGSLAGVLALPAFLTGAAQAWDAEQIQKIKQKAAEAEVAKHKGVKVKKEKDQSTTAMPPPPPSAFNHVKRNEIIIQYDRKEQRGLPGTISKSLGHVHLPSGRSSMNRAASRGATHAGSHMSTGMSKSVSSATKQANTVKEPNPTVARVLSWTGAMTSLMYIPAAYQAIHKAQYVTDDDAHAYKRRAINNDEGMEFDLQLPTVTCIPIARKGLNYVIPEGALQSQNVLSSSFSSTMPFYQDTSLNRRAESAALNKAGKHAKLVGIAGMGVGLGWLMHQLNQRRDENGTDENTLLRRDDSEMEGSEELERRWKPGKGSVLTSAIFAGTALSASGFGVPQLHATITEDPKAGNVKSRLQKRDQVILQRRQGFRHQLGRAATDKVTMFLATTATAYGAVKTGAASALYNAIVKPPPKSNPPQQHVRRDQDSKDSAVHNDDDDDQTILLDYEPCTKDDCQLERRSGRKTTIFAAALLGTFLGQRTGKSGQEKENKQYLEQIGQGSPKRRRMVQNEFVMQENALVKRSPGKNSEVVESASTTVQPYILPGTVAVTTLAASFAGRKAVKSAAKKELDRRDVESTFVKRGGKDKLGKTASQLARQLSKGKGPAVSHAVTETVHVTHVNLGQHGNTHHVNAPHGSHSGGNHHSPQHSISHSSKAGSSSSGSVQSKPHLQRQSSTASSSSSSPSTPHDGSRHGHRSKHQHEPNEQVKQFYRENSNVPMPSRVEEVHRIHHPPSAEHNGAHAGEEATKKKSSTGKKLIFATGGAALGALGHHQYTNFVDAKAQAAQEQPADPAAAPPVKRSLLQKRSPDRSRGRRRGSGGGGRGHSGGHGGTTTTFKMVHQHVFDHHLEPVGQQIKKGGGGKKGLIGALLLGAVGGVVGHAIYHNSKANQAANQTPPVNAEEATAPQPAEPPKEEKPAPPAPKKRNLDDQNNTILEKREKKGGGKLASALTGGLIGVAVAGYGYAFTHDQPGTRKKHTVPVGTLPQNTEGATKAKKRSVNEIVWQKEEATSFPLVEVDIVSDKGRDDSIFEEDIKSEKRNMLAKYFNKMSPKQKIGSAIGAGIALSTAAAMVDPGAKEAAHPITKRGLNDEQQLLSKRGKYGKKDIAVVSAIAGVAGLTGLMKRDEFVTETVEEREPIYQDIVERANPKSFQNRAFAIADYATIALMAGTLIKNGAGAISNSKAHRKRGLNTFNANESDLLVKRAMDSSSSKAELLKPIDVEYQSFLSKRSIGEDMVEEVISDDILEDISDDSSEDTISRRTVKMKLNGPFTHMLTSRASHTTSTAKAKAAHPSMDNLVGKMSMATIAGAITAPILKSVLGGGSSSPSKSPSHSPSPVKRNFTTPEISMEKRAEYSKYIEAVKQQVIEKPKKRDNSNSMDEIKLVKRKAAATADYGKYIEAVKHQVVEKPKKRDISISFDSMDGVKMVKRKAAATEYGKYIEAVKESAEKH